MNSKSTVASHWLGRSWYGLVLSLAVLLSATSACVDRRDFLTERTHPALWSNPTSIDFHGTAVLESAVGPANCTTCHGPELKGGTSGVSCASCHAEYPHEAGFADPSSGSFHGEYFVRLGNWNLSRCQACHGSNYDGKGVEEKTCLNCHVQPEGPEACNTCHGSSVNDAPPEDMAGNVVTTAIGVGAHQAHVAGGTWTSNMLDNCAHCHAAPVFYDDAGHIDNAPPPAEIRFGDLATNGGQLNTTWDRATATCGNVYCHGSFSFAREASDNQFAYVDSVMVGNNFEPTWTNVGAGQAVCGTCHGLPPTGHINNLRCFSCHPRVVDPDYVIIGPDKHINGKIEVF